MIDKVFSLHSATGQGQAAQTPDPQQAEERAPDDGFDDFWRLYPRKLKKERARQAWRALKLSARGRRVVVACLERWIATEWKDRRIEYIPHPATWLHDKPWKDDPAEAAPPPSPFALSRFEDNR